MLAKFTPYVDIADLPCVTSQYQKAHRDQYVFVRLESNLASPSACSET